MRIRIDVVYPFFHKLAQCRDVLCGGVFVSVVGTGSGFNSRRCGHLGHGTGIRSAPRRKGGHDPAYAARCACYRCTPAACCACTCVVKHRIGAALPGFCRYDEFVACACQRNVEYAYLLLCRKRRSTVGNGAAHRGVELCHAAAVGKLQRHSDIGAEADIVARFAAVEPRSEACEENDGKFKPL